MATTHEIARNLQRLADEMLDCPDYETKHVCDLIYLGYSSEKQQFLDFAKHLTVLRAGHARFACEVSGAVMPPAAGTHRSDSGAAQCRA